MDLDDLRWMFVDCMYSGDCPLAIHQQETNAERMMLRLKKEKVLKMRECLKYTR